MLGAGAGKRAVARLRGGVDRQLARLYVSRVADKSADPLQRCELHDMQNCAICNPPRRDYRRGQRLAVPDDAYVSIRGGRGVYHHPDCFNVTGDWEGADTATLGERVVHSRDELATLSLRPAECCQPPLF
jgi:hypothetical protein